MSDEKKYIGPYWGKPLKYSTGRDHLGMQATSVATYSVLLPGMTNLTQRLRYYSFYPWLIEQYAKQKRETGLDRFKRFLRRGELLYAYASIIGDEEQKGVVGSKFVKSFLKSNDIKIKKTSIDIAEGSEKYWKHSGGAFTQYYLAPLIDIGILTRTSKHPIPIVTETGRAIASIFSDNIGGEVEKMILSSIEAGKITHADLIKIIPRIMPDKINPTGQESDALLKQLLGPDSLTGRISSLFRRETIVLLLQSLTQDTIPDEGYDFPKAVYYRRGNNKKKIIFSEHSDTLYGWRFYQINEYMHFALEYLLYYLLQLLHDQGGWAPIDHCIKTMKKDIYKKINGITSKPLGISKTSSLSEIIKKIRSFNNASWYEEGSPEWLLPIPVEYTPINLAKAILLILALVARHDTELEEMNSFGLKYNMLRDGSFIDIFRFYRMNSNNSFDTFLEKLLSRKVISKHMEVSYKKTYGDNKNTLKFLYENNCLQGLEIIPPILTSPRLGSLMNYLRDLSLIKHNGEVTRQGQKLTL